MSNNPFFSDAAVEAALNALTALLNSGTLKIYSGTQPADANSSITGTLLATLTFGSTAFAAASASGSAGSRVASATANSITGGTAAATGTAAYFVLEETSTSAVVAMGSVGTSGCDLNLNTTSIVSGAAVSVTSFVITQTE